MCMKMINKQPIKQDDFSFKKSEIRSLYHSKVLENNCSSIFSGDKM